MISVSIDGFHRPRAMRHARGPGDPEGFYRDSYDLPALRAELLDPFGPGGDGVHRVHVFDARTDTPDVADLQRARPGAVLVVDGVFLHRPELRRYWTWSVWLDVSEAVALQRCVDRDGHGSADPDDRSTRRYVDGQRMYLREVAPQQRATRVVGNDVLSDPVLVR